MSKGRKVADITGQRFGRLIVLGRAPKQDRWHTRWFVKCDCGAEKTVMGTSLNCGRTQSCGCLRDEAFIKNKKLRVLPNGVSSRNGVVRRYQESAARKGLIWELSDELFDTLSQQLCHYCGRAPETKHHERWSHGTFVYNGIDRKDNSRGYTPDNVVSCCRRCNRAKYTMGYEEFLEFINRLCERKGACWSTSQS